MEKFTITEEPVRKHAKIDSSNLHVEFSENVPLFHRRDITRLPVEIVLEILSYLSTEDLHVLRQVSKFFARLTCDPVLWKSYEVMKYKLSTSEVIDKLKRMPLLKKFRMYARYDTDDILRQLSLSNKNLEELYIADCTDVHHLICHNAGISEHAGSTSKLYLRSACLIHILQRCFRLHTISIVGTRFRGCKFYRLLGNMGLRLKTASTLATSMQFRTFVKHAKQIDEKDREAISAMCTSGRCYWAPLHYVVTDYDGSVRNVLISYLSKELHCTFRSK